MKGLCNGTMLHCLYIQILETFMCSLHIPQAFFLFIMYKAPPIFSSGIYGKILHISKGIKQPIITESHFLIYVHAHTKLGHVLKHLLKEHSNCVNMHRQLMVHICYYNKEQQFVFFLWHHNVLFLYMLPETLVVRVSLMLQ